MIMTKVKDYIKNNRNFVCMTLIMAIAFVLIMIINFHTTYVADDYLYTFKFKTGYVSGGAYKIENLNNLIESMINHRNVWNGRLVSHSMLQILLMFGEKFVRVFNSLMFVLCGWLIYKHAYFGRNYENPLMLGFTYVLIWFLVPQFSSTIVWISGAANYLWLSNLILAFMLPFRMYAIRECYVKDNLKNIFFMALVGFLAGCTNENTGGGVLLLCIGFIIMYKIKGFKIPVWSWLSLTTVFMGMLFLLTAPANALRVKKELTFELFISNIENILTVTKETCFWVFVLMLVFLALGSIKKRIAYYEGSKYDCLIPIGYIGVSVAMILALALSPEFPPRAWFMAVILQIIVIMWLTTKVGFRFFKPKLRIWSSIISAGLVIVVFSTSYCVEFKNINSSYVQAKNVLKMIEDAAANGAKSVTVPRVKGTKSEYDIYSIPNYFVTPNKNSWINEWIAEYYGIEEVVGKK